ncbi:hypothetical protein [Marinifaba aquimaris]|nr:hypothetical protein [Marinifaba aquimaris]
MTTFIGLSIYLVLLSLGTYSIIKYLPPYLTKLNQAKSKPKAN